MERKVEKLLYDILDAINSIENYFGEKKYFAEYQGNKMRKRAIERELQIIGEAMKRLIEIMNVTGITEPLRIIDFRNRITHGYDSVEDDVVWGIIINHLPKLKTEVEALLKSE